MSWRRANLCMLFLGCGLMLATAVNIGAQKKELLDLTERSDLTPEDIIRGLVPPRTRGIRPTFTSPPSPTLPAVAITVLFDFDSAQILPEAAQNLRSVAMALQSSELASARIQIEGHTDSIGSDQYNQKLSERRARSVRQYLVKYYTITPERLAVMGRGKAEPIADNDSPEGRQKNRRVEFVNLDAN
jgi:outer membrane protein OmpA-like peptidoglycan-associated protein